MMNSNGRMDLTLKIMIVDESPVRAAIIEEGLREAGFSDVVRVAETGTCSRASMPSSPTPS
jgi:hypothetical protein